MTEAVQVELSYAAEAANAFGVAVPANALRRLRYNSESLVSNVNDEDSPEIDSDRQIKDVIPLGASHGGDVPTSLSFGNLDDMLQSAFYSVWSDLDVDKQMSVSGAGLYTAAAGDFDDAAVGDRVFVSGFADDVSNGWRSVTAVAGDGSTITAPDPAGGNVVENNAAAARIQSQHIKNARTRRSFTVQKFFSAIVPAVYHYYYGCVVQTLAMEFRAGASVTSTITVSSKSHESAGAAVFNALAAAAPTNLIFSPADTKGLSVVDSAGASVIGVNPIISGITVAINNNLREYQQLGDLAVGDIRPGRFGVEGTLEVYFQDRTLYDRFLAREEQAISWRTEEPNSSNRYYFDMPRVRVRNARVTAGGNDSDLIAQFDYRALGHRTRGYTLMMTRSPV